MKYRSPLYEHVETLVYLPLYLLGFKDFKQRFRMSMLVQSDKQQIQSLNKQLSNADMLIARLSSASVQVYNAELHFISEVVGWRAFTYHHPWISFFFLIPLLALFESSSLFVILLCTFCYCRFCFRTSHKQERFEERQEAKSLPIYDNLLMLETDSPSSDSEISLTDDKENDEGEEEKKKRTVRRRRGKDTQVLPITLNETQTTDDKSLTNVQNEKTKEA